MRKNILSGRNAAAPAILFALLLSGCSGSDSNAVPDVGGGAASVGAEPSAPISQEVQDYVTCLRENGMTTMDDPFRDEDGNVQLGGLGQDPGAVAPEVVQNAFDSCGEMPAELNMGAPASPEMDQEMQESMIATAKCMRGKGFDMSDPQADANGGFSQEFNPGAATDEEIDSAMRACQAEIGAGGIMMDAPGVAP